MVNLSIEALKLLADMSKRRSNDDSLFEFITPLHKELEAAGYIRIFESIRGTGLMLVKVRYPTNELPEMKEAIGVAR